MREILFRGKRISTGEWVEGWYEPPVKWDGHSFGTTIAYKCSEGYLDDAEVDPTTVGQYTGLQDKNGHRIFEGDIIHTDRYGGRTYVVIFDDDLCAFVGLVYGSNIFVTFEGDGEQYEVIGNIHDNPELMEVQNV